jgi:hypothetical protein
MLRVLVVGMSGAGKTTAARRVGAKLGLPFREMDALALGPDWSQPPGLVDEVQRITAEPAWIFDSERLRPVRPPSPHRADRSAVSRRRPPHGGDDRSAVGQCHRPGRLETEVLIERHVGGLGRLKISRLAGLVASC